VLIAIFLHFMATISKSDANIRMEYKLRKLYQLFIVEKTRYMYKNAFSSLTDRS